VSFPVIIAYHFVIRAFPRITTSKFCRYFRVKFISDNESIRNSFKPSVFRISAVYVPKSELVARIRIGAEEFFFEQDVIPNKRIKIV